MVEIWNKAVLFAAVFLQLAISECISLEHIFQQLQDNDSMTISPVMTDPENANHQYRKCCILKQENMVEVCFEIGTNITGEPVQQRLRIRRAETVSSRKRDTPSEGSASDKDPLDYSVGVHRNCNCSVPANIKTAHIKCTVGPSYVACWSYCALGTTLKEGIKRYHHCYFTENKWNNKFEECKEFVNCHLQLKSPGSLLCVAKDIDAHPTCEISCDKFGDKAELEKLTYTCYTDGKWGPPLPFCAKRKDGVSLVPAPDVVLHSGLSHPHF